MKNEKALKIKRVAYYPDGKYVILQPGQDAPDYTDILTIDINATHIDIVREIDMRLANLGAFDR